MPARSPRPSRTTRCRSGSPRCRPSTCAGAEFLLLKKSFDVFTNPHAERLLALLDPDEIVVFGVATDVCDDAAIHGFLDRGRRVRFVEDAARGLDAGRVAAALTAWRERGVEVSTVDAVLAVL